jgi:hypothetical protein
MTVECSFCGFPADTDEPFCPRCGHVVQLGVERDSITADRTTTYDSREPFQRVETPVRPKGLLSRVGEALATRKRADVPEPGRTSRQIPKSLRYAVLRRDDFHCRYCGRGPPQVILELDHARSWKEGGETTMTNLVTSCRDCNRGKSSRSVSPKIREPIRSEDKGER